MAGAEAAILDSEVDLNAEAIGGWDNKMVRISKRKALISIWTTYPELHTSPHMREEHIFITVT